MFEKLHIWSYLHEYLHVLVGVWVGGLGIGGRFIILYVGLLGWV